MRITVTMRIMKTMKKKIYQLKRYLNICFILLYIIIKHFQYINSFIEYI